MRKFIVLLGFLFCITFSPPTHADIGVILEGKTSPESKTEISYEQSIINTAKLKILNAVSLVGMTNEGLYTCSGTVIKNTKHESIVLTAKHCIGMVEELYVEGILVKDAGKSLFDDLAYIKLDQEIPNKTAVVISEFPPQRGDLAIVIGYPNMKLFASIGEMGIRTNDWRFAHIEVKGGVSGSGVYNQYGELTNIVWGAIGTKNSSQIGIFERYEDMVNFIERHKLL